MTDAATAIYPWQSITHEQLAALANKVRHWQYGVEDLFDQTALDARFARLLDVLAIVGWHRCSDHWKTPDDREVDAWEAMQYAVRMEKLTWSARVDLIAT